MSHRKRILQASILLVYILGLTATVWPHTICVREEKSGYDKCCEEYHPLKWFVSNDVTNHSVIIFLPGIHYLNSNDVDKALIRFDSKYNLSLIGSQCGGKLENSTVVCHGDQSGFLFSNSMNVSITNLEFQGCRADMNLTKGDNSLFYGGVFFHLSYYITISQVCIRDSKGYGLHMDNVCGSILIEHSKFVANENGNVVLWFRHCANYNETNTTTVKIHNTEFRDGFARNSQNATGLYLLLKQSHIQVSLTNLILSNNSGQYGGNMNIRFVDFAENTGHVNIEDSIINNGKASSTGGGIIVLFDREADNKTKHICNASSNTNPILTIRNTEIENNTANNSGGGLLLAYDERQGCGSTTRQIKIINCTISYNKAPRGGAIEITKHNLPKYMMHYSPQLLITIADLCIIGNSVVDINEQQSEEGIVESFSVESLVILNTIFQNNNGTALMLVSSGVQFIGNVTFEGNSAPYGGAIKICDSSQMYLNNKTRVRFINNNAGFTGGAIYAGNVCPTETPPCFFQVPQTIETIEDLAPDILYFEGNHAGIAGHAIYGGSVDNCFTDHLLKYNKSYHQESYYYSIGLYNKIFKFSDNKEPSKVTSDPYGICLCKNNTNQRDCKNRIYDVGEVYPGKYFSVYLTAVGQTNDTVPAILQVETNSTTFNVSKVKENIDESSVFCRNMTISIQAQEDKFQNISFNIKISKSRMESESSNYYRIPKLVVNAKLKRCPFIFELNKGKCDCHSLIKDLISCYIDSQTFTLKLSPHDNNHIDNGKWISCVSNNTTGKCDKIEGSKHCQRGHCSNASLTFNQNNLDLICTAGREGRLCSKCNDSYTLSLGTSECLKTDNQCHIWSTILLGIVFIFAGILLVCFVTLFNFTVAEGTVHGLLLYANCIQVIQYSLFHDSLPISLAFISWPNLDLGFKVCFYAGMTAYQKIWLEFGFLLYLLLLGVMIVYLSHRFVWFTRLAGRNVVPVLATIALFAYPKLVKNSVRVWHCHQNYVSSDNNTPYVWYMDETIECFKGKHLVLFIASIPVFIMAFLYMFCLLFIQCLQRRSSWFVLRWVNKLRPFFDAHTGPCRDHYRFWPGLLLFARMGLYLALWQIADNSTNMSYTIAGICMLLFFFACIFPRGVYKSWPLNVLDFSFIFNLGITSTFDASQSLKSFIIGWVSLSIAAFTFSLILVYHSFKRVRETRRWKRFMTRAKLQRNIYQINESDETPLIQEQEVPIIVQFTSPREPLLEDN